MAEFNAKKVAERLKKTASAEYPGLDLSEVFDALMETLSLSPERRRAVQEAYWESQ